MAETVEQQPNFMPQRIVKQMKQSRRNQVTIELSFLLSQFRTSTNIPNGGTCSSHCALSEKKYVVIRFQFEIFLVCFLTKKWWGFFRPERLKNNYFERSTKNYVVPVFYMYFNFEIAIILTKPNTKFWLNFKVEFFPSFLAVPFM